MRKSTRAAVAAEAMKKKRPQAAQRYGISTNLKPSPAVTQAIDPADSLMPVHKIAQETTGKRPARTTVWRWCSGRGCPRLPAVLVGNCWCVSRATWLAWLQFRTDARLRKAGVPIDVDDDELTDVGLGE